jgi:hypothetical protein
MAVVRGIVNQFRIKSTWLFWRKNRSHLGQIQSQSPILIQNPSLAQIPM